MNGPRKLLAAAFFTLLMTAFSSASDIYLAQNAAGANSGADCADAHAVSWFNSSSNWGTGSGKIGPGTTVHLCGTFNAPAGSSGYLTFQSSGTSGNPITLLFEPGAVLTATYWSGPVINLSAHSYVTVDGGTNGTIQATDNGTNLHNQQDNAICINNGTPAANASNVTVQNLTCSNLYVDASTSDNGGENTFGFDIWNTSNLVIQNNTFHDMKWAIRNSYATGNTYSNPVVTIAGNNFYNIDHGIFIGDSNASAAAVVTGIYIYANTFGSMANWDNALDNNHHDWIHINANSTTTRISSVYVYNNYGSGDVGVYNTAGFFSYPNSASAVSNVYFFNNVFVNTSANHCWNNGFVSWYSAGSLTAVNNTFVSQASSCKDNGLNYSNSSTGLTFLNNVVQNAANSAIYATSGVNVSSMDYNNYHQSSAWFWKGSWETSMSGWQAVSGYDPHGTIADPQLTSTYHLIGSTSSSWQTGTNLHSMCNGQPNPGLGALCSDKAGVARQTSGSWDIGAYEDSAVNSGSLPSPPTALSAVVQ